MGSPCPRVQDQGGVMAGTRSVYLDFNATTPLAPEVLQAISEALRDAWGNPSSSHGAGKPL